MAKYTKTSYPVQLGPLGHIKGITISSPSPTSSGPLCHYFGGIPYALAPTGPYRFRRPRQLPPGYTYGTKSNPGQYTGGAGVCPQPPFRGKPDRTTWTEDCLQLNIWIPAGKAPEGGWPVYFYIHGGWLQFGTPNAAPTAYAPLLGETEFQCMIVAPSYRLNVFGFLASEELAEEAGKDGETAGNMGFWDQRTALEWTWKNISFFGGNADNITVGGYSAGAHSTFQQLAYDLFQPPTNAIIKRAIMWSNGPGVQPKSLPEHQLQFNELLTALSIPLHLSSRAKLAALRALPAPALLNIQLPGLTHSEFRACSDDAFVSSQLIQRINTGAFAQRLRDRGVRILNGECRDEHYMYGSWRPPPRDSYDAVFTRLVADYPHTVVQRLMPLYCPQRRLPAWAKSWADLFGKVYADMQVHALERGFAGKLAEHGVVVGRELLRYRIEWRAKCTDTVLPPEWGVTHSSDYAIWWWGNGLGEGLTEGEKEVLRPVNSVFARFVKGEDVRWERLGPKWMYKLSEDGEMRMWEDEMWEDGLRVWDVVNRDGARRPSFSKL